MRSFASDNYSGIHPDVLERIRAANLDHAVAYGGDGYTERAIRCFKRHFGEKCDVHFVLTGTAANVLGIKTVARSFHSVLCSSAAHMNVDECGAVEHFSGCKLEIVPSSRGKISPEELKPFLHVVGDQHHVQPRVLSITQATELGTVYTPDEIRELSEFAHSHDLLLHVDGARLSNAAASLGVSLKALTADVGVDILSFGGTKNGLLAAEAVVFFDPSLSQDFKYVRKQGMQLVSKMRFVAAQFEALLEGDLWLRNAQHANLMARKLEQQVRLFPEISILRPVEANAVFATIPHSWIPVLQSAHPFYVWNESTNEVRWMTSFDTTDEDIEQFVTALAKCR